MAAMGNVSETPTPTTCLKSPAVHLRFVRQYAPICIAIHSWLPSFEEKETLQYASHLHCSTPPICTAVRPPICTAVLLEKYWGWGHRNVSEARRSMSVPFSSELRPLSPGKEGKLIFLQFGSIHVPSKSPWPKFSPLEVKF